MARKPGMADEIDDANGAGEKRAAPVGADPKGKGGEGAAAGDAAGDKAAALDEIVRGVRYLSGLADQAKKKRPAGPSRAAFDKLVKTVSAIGENAGETRKLVEGLSRKDPGDGGAPDEGELAEAVRASRADFGRWAEGERRGRRRWVALAIAAGFPAALLLGLLVQHQFQVIPLYDPSGGWRGWVWETHGRAVVDCAVEAMRTDGEVDCPLVVRRP